MSAPQRMHPINIAENLSRFFFLLILPVLRGFAVAIRSDFKGWLSGAWMDILVVVLIVMLAILEWYRCTYEYKDEMIQVKKGLIWRKTITIPRESIHTVCIVYSFFLKPFRAVHLKADTIAGDSRAADLDLTVRTRQAEEILQRTLQEDDTIMRRAYAPSWLSIMALSLMSSNTFVGIVFITTLISQTGQLLGKEFERRIIGTFEEITRIMALGIPPATAALAYLILAGYLVAFALNLIRYRNFSAQRQQGVLSISGGLFTQRHYVIREDQINYVDIRQSVLTKLLGLKSVFLNAVGFGKSRDDMSVLILTATASSTEATMRLLLPGYSPSKRQLRHNFGALLRFMMDPLYPCLGIPLVSWVLGYVFPGWAEFIRSVAALAMMPAIWFLTVRLIDFFTSGVSKNGPIYTIRYSNGFYLHTVVIHEDKIASVQLRQSILQHMDGHCDLFIFSRSEKTVRHRCRNLLWSEAEELFGLKAGTGRK
jgi:putative membrane protein